MAGLTRNGSAPQHCNHTTMPKLAPQIQIAHPKGAAPLLRLRCPTGLDAEEPGLAAARAPR